MKIGILKEEKIPLDSRVPLTPDQCNILIKKHPSIDIVVMTSDFRCFSDEMYMKAGVRVVNDLYDCDLLIGIKEVPESSLIKNKTYCFFSHTIKGQEYNRSLLASMIKLNIKMIDYEVLKDLNGKRLIGFGRYAGIVGAYNGFLAYGLKSGRYKLKLSHHCYDRAEMEAELNQIKLIDEKIIITGGGRVGSGVLEIMKSAKIKEVSKSEFVSKNFDEPVFVNLDTLDYNVRIDGLNSNKQDFYNNPTSYKSIFMDFAKHADIFIAGHYFGCDSPFLFTRKDAKDSLFNLKVVADISCDIDGPVASTIRSSTIIDPIYGYNTLTEEEDDFMKNGVVAVMAVDNLPCALPKDASEDFGNELMEKILPLFIYKDEHQILHNATICNSGDLTDKFEYLRGFLS